MSLLEAVSLVIAVALFALLTWAMLRPERF